MASTCATENAAGREALAKRTNHSLSTKVLSAFMMLMIAVAGCPMCLTGLGENVGMGMDKCQWVDERQLLEVGNFYEDGLGKYTLRPISRFGILLV